MIKIMFVCHGNICRSPMAEYIMRRLVTKAGLGDKFYIASSATSDEEIGNGVYPPVMRLLRGLGIDASDKRAVRLTERDGKEYDFLVGMDGFNIRNMRRILKNNKPVKLLNFTGSDRDVDDPWYTGDFQRAYEDIKNGCEALFLYIKENGLIDKKQGTTE